MTKLEYLVRPMVPFDPYNKDHRRYYADYLETGGWGSCPVRFICPEDNGDNLPSMIKNSLIAWYVEREFGGGKMAQERSKRLAETADKLYRDAGQMRKEAESLLKPRR